MSLTFHIGCSGYHYRHWRGAFYPEKMPVRLWFDYDSQYFRTLELNVAFYRFPQLSFLEKWYAQSPPGFRFAVKAPMLIAHYKQFNNVQLLLGDFYDTTGRKLLKKLGPIRFQLPPRLAYDPPGWPAFSIASTLRLSTCSNFGTPAGGGRRCTTSWPGATWCSAGRATRSCPMPWWPPRRCSTTASTACPTCTARLTAKTSCGGWPMKFRPRPAYRKPASTSTIGPLH